MPHNTELYIHYPELYIPATDTQLREFSHKLGYVAKKMSAPIGEMHSVEFDVKVGFGEGDMGRIYYYYECDEDDVERFTVTVGRLIPIDKSWNNDVARALMGDEYIGYNEFIDEKKKEEGIVVDSKVTEGEDEYGSGDDDGVVEGYLEHESKIDIIRARRYIDAKKSTTFNVLDDHHDEIDAHIGHYRDAVEVDYDERLKDLERLYLLGEVMLADIGAEEALLSLPTVADLIICIKGLINSGLLSSRTTAFRGAKPYMGLVTFPNVYG